MVNKIWLGIALALVMLTASFYILMPEKVRIDFEKTRTIFKVYEDNKFVISGIEYIRLFDGTTLMRAKNRTMDYTILDSSTTAKRVSIFKDEIIIEELYEFDNDVINVENVPISHKICFTNASDKIFEYMIDKIEYDGETKDITSPFSFGKNMKLTFQDGYYRAKVYNYIYATDKIKIRYRVTEDFQCFDVRLFDPEEIEKETSFLPTSNEYGEIKYSQGTEDTPNPDGSRNLILYSGVRNVYEDDGWKRMENARSLKDKGFNVIYLKKDDRYDFEIIDFNFTNIQFKPIIKDEEELIKDIPIKVDDIELSSINYKSLTDKQELSFKVDNILSKNFTIGEYSTTIKLQIADIENLADTYVSKLPGYEDTNFGTNIFLTAGNYPPSTYYSNWSRIYIMFNNISSIPPGTIDEAKLVIPRSLSSPSGALFAVHRVYNWGNSSGGSDLNETTMTWNNQPCGIGFDNSTYCNLTADSTLSCGSGGGIEWKWYVNNSVESAYNEGKSNVSFVIKRPTDDDTATYVISGPSKEYATVASRPYLNITYSPDTTPPTFSVITDNSTATTPTNSSDVQINITITDEINVDFYTLSHNDTTIACSGTLNCSQYTTETTCENCSQCESSTSGGIPDYTNRVCTVNGSASTNSVSCANNNACDEDATDATIDSCNDIACGGGGAGEIAVWNITLNATVINVGDDLKITCNIECHSAAQENAIIYDNGSGWKEVDYDSALCGDGRIDYETVITVEDGDAEQYVRCIAALTGVPGTTCYTSNFNDHDDMSFNIATECNEIGSCSACSLDECDTNCSAAGCSLLSEYHWANETIIDVESTSIGVIWNYTIENFPTTGGILGVRFWANDTSDNSNISDIHTIIVQPVITDTCSPTSPLTADHIFLGSDNCVLSSNLDAGGNTVRCVGAGTLTLQAIIYNMKSAPDVAFNTHGCKMACHITPNCFG